METDKSDLNSNPTEPNLEKSIENNITESSLISEPSQKLPTQGPIINLLHPGRDISIKPEESKDQFGDELFEQLIINFVEKDYEDKKTQIEEALISKNAANLYYIVHTFKTTARMLCIEDFAKECEIIQEYSFKGREDWDKLIFLVQQFLQDFQAVYEDAKNIYDRDYKPKPAEIMEDPYIESQAVPSDNTINQKIDSAQNSFRYFVENKRRGSIAIKNEENLNCESSEEAEDKVDSSIMPNVRKLSNHHRDSEMVDKVYELTETPKIIPKKLGSGNDKKIIGKKIPNFKNIENVSNKQFFFTNNSKTSNSTSPYISGTSPSKPMYFKTNMFQVDPSKIAMNENQSPSKEKLQSLEKELINLSTEFYQSLDSDDKEEFLRIFRNFKFLCKNYKFEHLQTIAEEWEKMIQSADELSDLRINFEDISKLLISMGGCAIKNNSNSSSASKKVVISLSNPMKREHSQSNTSSSNPNEDPPVQPGSAQTYFVSSPFMNKRLLPSTKSNPIFNQITMNKNDEDLIYQELKPIKFDGLFRKDLTPEEITEIIKKIEQDAIIDNQPTTKVGGPSRAMKGASLNSSNVITDNAYPFKQDCFKFSCNIY